MDYHSWIFRLAMVVSVMLATADKAASDSCYNLAIPASTPNNRFLEIDGGSVVRDLYTGLDWARCSVGQDWDGGSCTGEASTFSWQAALEAAVGRDGQWRVPDLNQLFSIVELCQWQPAINGEMFPNTVSGEYWTSSPVNLGRVWSVDFDGGHESWSNPFDLHYLRLMRIPN